MVPVLARPVLRPDLRAVVVDGETVVLFSEREHFRLAGGPVAGVLPLLNGVRAPEEVVAALDGSVAPEEVYYTLLELEQRGYLVEADGGAPRERALLAGLGVGAGLRGARVAVSVVGEAKVEPLREALRELGVGVDAEAPLRVVLADDYLRADLGEVNGSALVSGRRWLLAKPVGTVLWLGPLFVPGETGCWACLADRLRGHRPVEQLAAELEPSTSASPPPAATAATTGVAAGLLVAELVKELAGGGSTLWGRLLTLDLATLAAREHALPRRPQCAACGDPTVLLRRPGRMRLRPLRATSRAGGERVHAADETLRRRSGLVSPITGVVSSLERIDRLPATLHLYSAGPVPRPAASPRQVELALLAPSGGKGPTDAQARASALCEGVERYSACWREPRYVVEASYDEVAERAVHPDRLLLFSETQRRERDARNAAAEDDDARWWIPEPFDDAKSVAWTECWSISLDRLRLLPAGYCFLDFPLPPGHRFCRADSNGCAAGNEREEAILQGLLELVERDAVALWWYNRGHRPGIDLATSSSADVASAVETYGVMGRAVWALDLTNDLGIPVIAAVSCSWEDERGVTYGFGAHLDAEIALSRAVSELTQMTHAVGATRRGSLLERWLAEVTPATDTWLAPHGQVQLAPAAATGDLAADIRAGVEAIARAGHETLVVDLTLPDVGVPVVKVVAPGLRHFFPRFAPGRLYDVPVKLGWLEQPTPSPT